MNLDKLDKKKSAIIALLLAVNGAIVSMAPTGHINMQFVALASCALLAVCALLKSPVLDSLIPVSAPPPAPVVVINSTIPAPAPVPVVTPEPEVVPVSIVVKS